MVSYHIDKGQVPLLIIIRLLPFRL